MKRTARLGGALTLVVCGLAASWATPASADSTAAELAGELAKSAATPPDAGRVARADAAADAAEEPAVVELEQQAANVWALTKGSLDPAVALAGLFPIDVADEAAVQIDAARLAALLRGIDAAAKTKSAPRHPSRSTADANADDVEDEGAGLDAKRWDARLELDRARLAFYQLPPARRAELLADHARTRADAGPGTDAGAGRQSDAQMQRHDALAAARTAHADAERAVETERLRLEEVARAQQDFAAGLTEKKAEIAERREVTLGWKQRAREARAKGAGASGDRFYEDLRRALRAARDDLSTSLGHLSAPTRDVPSAGDDLLADLRADVDTQEARATRDRVDAEARRLAAEELSVRRDEAAQLFEEVDTLNRERLGLLDALTPEKRDAVTGFTAAGWEQAAAEVRQLSLILRYHAFVIEEWVPTLRHPSLAFGSGVIGGAFDVLKWIVVLGGFFAWRRRSEPILRAWRIHSHAEDRNRRHAGASFATRLLTFVGPVHRPAEWLVLLFLLHRLLPPATTDVLEVRVGSALLTWIFGAALIVDTLNALAGSSPKARASEASQAATLRLQSLRLVARVVVVVGLVLVLSSMLVGQGTIYDWVSSTCWLASFPVLLVLVRRWRSVVFERIERVRKPTPIQRWVLLHRRGWTSFFAATVGATNLFVAGGVRGARSWVGRFDLTRRALAYLFRRQLGKMSGQPVEIAPLPVQKYDALGPELPSAVPVACDADDAVKRLLERMASGRGGMIAVVGERGIGKSTTLRRLRLDEEHSLLLDANPSGLEALRVDLARALHLSDTASLDASAAALEASSTARVVLVDDAHHLVRPIMGGLAAFDLLLAAASRRTKTTTWIFAIDLVVWQFLERARGARPLFDEVMRLGPWREEEIVRVLQTRTDAAGLSPTFESLLERLPANADDVDRQEALVQRAADYYRLLWDYASGNPGVALHMWRRSLGVDGRGTPTVRLFAALDTTDLERLPDSTIFVLRAVLQMTGAAVEALGEATLLRPAEVADALRYALARGYVEECGRGYRVTWTWFRAVTQFLQRRHLLVSR